MPIFVRDVKTTSYYEKYPKEQARTPASSIPANRTQKPCRILQTESSLLCNQFTKPLAASQFPIPCRPKTGSNPPAVRLFTSILADNATGFGLEK
jgi:hypothetical protein